MRGHDFGRDDRGRYAHTDTDAMCQCGHTLRNHTAARVRGQQPCMAMPPLTSGCDCESFVRNRRKL
jgi:hypothetical protein